MKKRKTAYSLMAVLLLLSPLMQAQTLPVPDGRRIRDIVDDHYPDGKLLVGATTGAWGLDQPIGEIMDREFSYVTPENDFKQSVVRANPNEWNWSRADAWLQHIIDNNQIARMHGPISPQCSKWAKEDTRTAAELSQELDTFMTALCKRYNGVEGIKYLDVVNEIALSDGRWHQPKTGTEEWENPWFLIGQDTDPNQTPLYVKQAFAIAHEHAPDLKLILNNHCHPGTAGMEKVKETVLYLRDLGYRLDGLGWQAHVEVGWATEENLQELRQVIDWCQARNLEFHITEFDAWIMDPGRQTLEQQAYTFKAIMDVLIEKQDSLTIGWNTWHITDASGWKTERIPSLFDDKFQPKPAYYAFQLALESRGDYTTPHQVSVVVKHRETGESLEGCMIRFNNEITYSDSHGESILEPTPAGRYPLEVRGEGMETFSGEIFSIYTDTLLTVWLDSATYEVTYRVEDTNSQARIPDVEVSVNNLIQTTDIDGETTFHFRLGNYTSSFTKPGFGDTQAEHAIRSDSLLIIQLERTESRITFRLSEESADAGNAMVVMNGDSAWFDMEGDAAFHYYPPEQEYHYRVISDNYPEKSGSLYLERDTVVTVILNTTGTRDDSANSGIHIYPNPACGHFNISIDNISRGLEYQVISSTGRLVLNGQIHDQNILVSTGTLDGGIYIVRFLSKEPGMIRSERMVILKP